MPTTWQEIGGIGRALVNSRHTSHWLVTPPRIPLGVGSARAMPPDLIQNRTPNEDERTLRGEWAG